MSKIYYRPLVSRHATGPALAGGWARFDAVEVLRRGQAPRHAPASDIPDDILEALCTPRAPWGGVDLSAPRVMGILNVTPDSFSDGGRYLDPEAALAQAAALAGADILDVGGESTRPGAQEVPVETEIARTRPVIAALAGGRPLSIDTRKAAVAAAALEAGAVIVNDVSGLDFDADLAPLVADRGAALCLMHAQGLPETMQDDPRYDDVLLDVYDALAARVARAEAAGIPRARIAVDPGIGFGKTEAHNLALLRGLSLFHGLGCAILLGVSRKRFIGRIGGAGTASARDPGTIAVTLAGVAQGVQIHRVHDVAAHVQALALWDAVTDNKG